MYALKANDLQVILFLEEGELTCLHTVKWFNDLQND